MHSEREKKAMDIAVRAHGSQARKYSGQPYIVHPAEVAALVRSVHHTEDMLAAAWLHDTLEDTDLDPRVIREELGESVLDLVLMLTDVSVKSDGNRKVRKEIDRVHTSKASPSAKTVKLADLISNSLSIREHGRGFVRVYLAEKRELLNVLKEGNAVLWARAAELAKD